MWNECTSGRQIDMHRRSEFPLSRQVGSASGKTNPFSFHAVRREPQ